MNALAPGSTVPIITVKLGARFCAAGVYFVGVHVASARTMRAIVKLD